MRWARQRKGLIGYLILAGAVAASLFAVYLNQETLEQNRVERIAQINAVNRAQCKSLQNLYVVIRKTIQDGSRAIKELDYYRDHPAERERALARNRETFELFRIPPCPDNIVIPNGDDS